MAHLGAPRERTARPAAGEPVVTGATHGTNRVRRSGRTGRRPRASSCHGSPSRARRRAPIGSYGWRGGSATPRSTARPAISTARSFSRNGTPANGPRHTAPDGIQGTLEGRCDHRIQRRVQRLDACDARLHDCSTALDVTGAERAQLVRWHRARRRRRPPCSWPDRLAAASRRSKRHACVCIERTRSPPARPSSCPCTPRGRDRLRGCSERVRESGIPAQRAGPTGAPAGASDCCEAVLSPSDRVSRRRDRRGSCRRRSSARRRAPGCGRRSRTATAGSRCTRPA